MQSLKLFSCDMCGCYMGITPYGNQSSFGIYYRYRAFNGYTLTINSGALFPDGHLRNAGQGNTVNHHDATSSTYLSSDYEIYRTAEFRVKYYLHKSFEINAVLPYRFNSKLSGNEVTKVSGFGDINLFGGYHLINKVEDDDLKQRLIIGAGIKLASGNYKEMKNDYRLDVLIQPGTGTTDGFLYANYFLGIKKFGISLNGNYKINGTNSLHEHIDNSVAINATMFYKVQVMDNKFTIVPKINSSYENTKGLYADGNLVSGTAINLLMIGPALDLFYKKLELNLSLELPAFEKQDSYTMTHSGSINIGVVYNFTQTKYLFKKSKTENQKQ